MTLELMKARYAELCLKRDMTNARLAPLKARLEKANAELAEKQALVNELAQEIQDLRGGEEWLDLKREIGALATAIQKLKK